MRIGSLFSGYGGLEQGVQSVLGGTVAWHSEIDPGACKILAHRHPDVPNLGDITAVDWAAVEPVDVLTGGFPCQDVSAAGKRAGLNDDTRSGLWAQMVRAIDELRPSLVVAENVRGLLSACALSELEPCPRCLGDESQPHRPVLRALGRVVGDLAELGYVGRWGGLRAADIGAPHGRFRVFVTAWPAGDTALRGRDGARPAGWSGEPARPARGSGLHAADADGERLARTEQPAAGRRTPADHAGGRGEPAAHPDQSGSQGSEPARGRDLPDRRTTPHPEGDGRHEGRPEPARLIGGPDAALGGDDVAAYAHGGPIREQPVTLTGCVGATVAGHAGADAAADPDGDGLEGLAAVHGPESSSGRGHADRLGVEAGGVDWGQYGPAVRRWERSLGRRAPEPTQRGKNGQPRLSPAFVEWLMGLPAGWVTDVPGLTRNEQLKALGNGVVPQQAAAALRILLPTVEVAA